MDEQNVQQPERPVNPARKKRSQMRVFKEVYLPVIIAGAAVILILIFIVGSIVRAVQKSNIQKQASIAASQSLAEEETRLAEEAQALMEKAAVLADGFDYAGAAALIDSFSGDLTKYPELTAKRDEYAQMRDTMVIWDDPSQVVNLSFQLLIADANRAFNDETYADSFKRNFITTSEFSAILQQLYDNGYILVRLEDFITTQTSEDGSIVYTNKPLYLPEGKKPLVLTQTNVNYNLYLVDSDGDMIADQGGSGFASKMIFNGSSVVCEMVDASGQTLTGAYDLVPILDAFVAEHPDFSFRGAKATLALTGYNGLFGYRTNSEAREQLGEEAYTQAVQQINQISSALRASGYTMACYTYGNIPYGDNSIAEIQADLSDWNAEVVPVLGGVDILVYAQKSDISAEAEYSGEKYETLHNAGFNYYVGFCNNGKPWVHINDNYVRQGRILVSGDSLQNNPDWFTGMFDAAAVLDPARTAFSE